MTIDEYIDSHIAPEPDYLYRLWRATNIHMLHGRMASGHLQGRLLKMLVSMIRPRNILEVGTFSVGQGQCLVFTNGGAALMYDCGGAGDEKAGETAARYLLSRGASRLDVLVLSHYDRDPQTRGIETFNDYVMNDGRVEQVILPLRDGLTLIRKQK